jgi:hypothetical protein
MAIKRTDALRFTTTESTSKQAEFTEDVAQFKKIQDQAKANQEDRMTQTTQNAIDDLLGPSFGPNLPSTDIFRQHDKDSSENTTNARPIPTSDSNEKQKLFTDLRSQFVNRPPQISSDSIDKQSKFTEAVANFKEIQNRVEENALRRQGQEVIGGALTSIPLDRGPGLGMNIPTTSQIREGRVDSSESETKSKKQTPVPTSESYAKQKLFTELMASNKDSPDK